MSAVAVPTPKPKSTLQPPLIAVKVGVGHEEDEALLKRTDLPAAGWVKRVYRQGPKLFADFREMPQVIEDLINRKAFRKISAEIYTDFADQGETYGLVLRRAVLLGGEVPQVKSLADIPTVANGCVDGVEIFEAGEHRGRIWTMADLDQIVANFERLSSEGTAKYSETRFTWSGIFACHELEKPMLKKRFHATPKQLRERAAKFTGRLKTAWQKFADEPAPPADAPADAPAGDAAPPADVTRDDMVQMLAQFGMDLKVIEGIADDAALAEVLRVVKSVADGGGKSPEPEPPPTEPAPEPEPGTQMSATPPIAPAPTVPAGGAPSQVTIKYGDKGQALTLPADILKPLVDAAVKPLQDQLAAAQTSIGKFQRDTKKQAIDAFCDRMKSAGKLLPAEEEHTKARLQRADAIAKFSDGRTELDLQMAEIEARPQLLKMSEVVKTGKTGSVNADAEVRKVETFAEQNPTVLKAAGKTKDTFVAAFKAAQAKKPSLTAELYGIPAQG